MNLDGKKTYIIAIAMGMYAIGGAVSKKVDLQTAIEVFLEALAIMGLRHGISFK